MKLSRRTAPSHAGQCVLVTGGASGLGLELVKLFVADAARVVVADLHAERPASVPDGVDYLTLDVRDDAAWADALAWVEQHWGRLDVLVNNAGVMTPPERMLTKDGHELQWGSNFLGPSS